MPGSKRTFEYVLIPDDAQSAERILARARKILGWACDGDTRIECHGITGEGVGVITLNLTIQHRDQWACRQLAQDVLNKVVWGVTEAGFRLALTSNRQPPHDARGYERGNRTKRYRERRQPDQQA